MPLYRVGIESTAGWGLLHSVTVTAKDAKDAKACCLIDFENPQFPDSFSARELKYAKLAHANLKARASGGYTVYVKKVTS